MAENLAEVADALAETIKNATGLRAYAYIPANIQTPACIVSVGRIERSTMVMGSMDMPFELVVLVDRADDRAGQLKLYEYVSFDGPKSVWQAFESADPLGLGCDAKVTGYRPLGIEEVAAYGYFGGAFDVIVLPRGA